MDHAANHGMYAETVLRKSVVSPFLAMRMVLLNGRNGKILSPSGMSTSQVETAPRAERVEVNSPYLTVHLADGRRLLVPLSWFPRLAYGNERERGRYELWDEGSVLAWPDLDEHIAVEDLLAGCKSREGRQSLERWKIALEERRRQSDPGPWVEPQPLPEWWNEEEGE